MCWGWPVSTNPRIGRQIVGRTKREADEQEPSQQLEQQLHREGLLNVDGRGWKNNGERRLGPRHAYTAAKIYTHALPDRDPDVAATGDKLMTKDLSRSPGHKMVQKTVRKTP